MLPSLWGKRWVRNWASTLKGQRTLEELLDLGYLLDPPPISGGARNLDNVDDKIARSADDIALDIGAAGTLCFQVLAKIDDTSAAIEVIGGKRAGAGTTNAGWSLYKHTDNVARWAVTDGTDEVIAGSTAIGAGVWIAYTCFIDSRSSADRDVIQWRDGTQNSLTNSTILGSPNNSEVFALGCHDANTTPIQFFDGDIAYARIWTLGGAAWASGVIAKFVESRNRLYLPAGWAPEGTMQLQWVLWDSAGLDYSGNSLTGTFTGTTAVDDPPQVTGPGGGLQHKRGFAAAGAGVGSNRMMMGIGT